MTVDGDAPEVTSGNGTYGRMMMMSISIVVIVAIVVMAAVVYLLYLPPSEDGIEEEREYYSGEPGDYYGPGIGPVYMTGCNAGLVNEEYGPLDLMEYDELPVYTLTPPQLETRQDAVVLLAGNGYDVSNFSYYYNDNYTKGHVFSRTPLHVSVELGGAICVQLDSPSPPLWQPNITEEEAIALATEYMENHTGIPEGAVMDVHHDNVGNMAGDRCITSF